MARRISSEEDVRDNPGSTVAAISESGLTGGSVISGGGVASDISRVPQADRSRLSAMNRTMSRRI
jgi:hypothetical protein